MTDTTHSPGYSAGVPRPPMAFSIDVPDHWTVLDLNPETWDGWIERFLDERVAERPDRVEQRPELRRTLVDIVEQLHREKVFMAALLVADVAGEIVSANATLAWREMDTHGEGIPVAGLEAVYSRAPASPGEDLGKRRVKVVQLPVGGAVRLATRKTAQMPGMPKPRPVAITQYFVPLPSTDWLAVITTGTADLPLAAGVEEVADGVAASLVLRQGAPSPP